MPTLVSDTGQWRQRLKDSLPSPLARALAGGSKLELLAKVEATLMVFDNQVLHLETGNLVQYREDVLHDGSVQGGARQDSAFQDGVLQDSTLQDSTLQDSALQDAAHRNSTRQKRTGVIDPALLAQAGRSLLGTDSTEKSVLLLLPPAEFVATTVSMPGVARESLVSALRLQADSLLPSYEETLLVAADSPVGEGQESVALWIAEQTVDDLFAAFEQQGLFLTAVAPRVLEHNTTSSHSPQQALVDADAEAVTYVVLKNNIPVQWLHVNKVDFEQAEFVQQWQQQTGLSQFTEPTETTDANNNLLLDSSRSYLLHAKAKATASGISARYYSFFANGALNASKKTAKSKRLLWGAAAVAAMLLVAASPFIRQGLEFRSLASDLESQRDFSFEARQDQAVVVNFDNEWGPLNDFPDQLIREAMFTLDRVLDADALSSLEINEGLIKIQGTSTEPQALLQRLEQDPMFTEVVFARATNNSRYYIDLRLSTVNFEGYMVRYFPDSR